MLTFRSIQQARNGTGEDGIFYCTPCKGQGIC